MDTQDLIIASYVFSLPLAVFNLFFMPRRGTMSQYMENLRRNSAIVGLIPCGPLSLIVVAIGAGVYYLRARALTSSEQSISASFTTKPDSLNQGNPFGGGASAGASPGGNPFQSPTSPNRATEGRANPFADVPPSEREQSMRTSDDNDDRSRENPFL